MNSAATASAESSHGDATEAGAERLLELPLVVRVGEAMTMKARLGVRE